MKTSKQSRANKENLNTETFNREAHSLGHIAYEFEREGKGEGGLHFKMLNLIGQKFR